MNCANHPDRERIAFCQNCGKPLCQECMRTIGSAVFCESCLAARLATTPPPSVPAPSAYTYTDPASGAPFSSQPSGPFGSTTPGGPTNGTIPPPNHAHNPWLAGLLGFIPGVGAMYNEQYAKGIVHLVVFAILVSLTDSHGLFGLFIAGWVFYMAIEAYHTAAARRDGRPLPNPFGLNDIGERLGFGRAWSGGGHPHPGPVSPSAPGAPGTPAAAPDLNTPPPGFVPPAPAWGAPPQPTYPPSYQPGFQASYPQGYQAGYYPPVPPVPFANDAMEHPIARFPIGAIWLIVLGALFLVANAGIFHAFSGRFFVPVLLLGLSVWIFINRMSAYGSGFADYDTPGYQLRLYRAAKGAAWIALVGLLFLLDDLGLLSWSHSWPLFLILAGVLAVFKRAAYTSVAAPYPPYPTTPPAPAPAPTPAEPTASETHPGPNTGTDSPFGNHTDTHFDNRTDNQEGR
jgi:B-box zinc finger